MHLSINVTQSTADPNQQRVETFRCASQVVQQNSGQTLRETVCGTASTSVEKNPTQTGSLFHLQQCNNVHETILTHFGYRHTELSAFRTNIGIKLFRTSSDQFEALLGCMLNCSCCDMLDASWLYQIDEISNSSDNSGFGILIHYLSNKSFLGGRFLSCRVIPLAIRTYRHRRYSQNSVPSRNCRCLAFLIAHLV